MCAYQFVTPVAEPEREALVRGYAEQGLDIQLEPLYQAAAGIIWTAEIAGGDAAWQLWLQLRAQVENTGYWPVLLGAGSLQADNLAELGDYETTCSPEETLALAAQINAQAWFASREEYLPGPDDEEEDEDEWADRMARDSEAEATHPATPRLSIPYDLFSGESVKQLRLALVPTRFPWEVAAYLFFGGWNACPNPEEQVAIQQAWHSRYGAELVAMSNDILEFTVSRPPVEDEAALALAQEQYLFCDDIVEQGLLSIDNLRQTLQNAPFWYFWWD